MQRFTISLDDALASEFDRLIAERGYGNRSEAVRDLLRGQLDRQRETADPTTACVACLSYVYNHHERDLGERLTAMHHAHHDLTLSSTHVHLDHEHCLETVLLRGPAVQVRALADAVCAERGVHHGHLNLISVQPHDHHQHGDDAGAHVHLKPMN